jgi:hypothetical protein
MTSFMVQLLHILSLHMVDAYRGRSNASAVSAVKEDYRVMQPDSDPRSDILQMIGGGGESEKPTVESSLMAAMKSLEDGMLEKVAVELMNILKSDFVTWEELDKMLELAGWQSWRSSARGFFQIHAVNGKLKLVDIASQLKFDLEDLKQKLDQLKPTQGPVLSYLDTELQWDDLKNVLLRSSCGESIDPVRNFLKEKGGGTSLQHLIDKADSLQLNDMAKKRLAQILQEKKASQQQPANMMKPSTAGAVISAMQKLNNELLQEVLVQMMTLLNQAEVDWNQLEGLLAHAGWMTWVDPAKALFEALDQDKDGKVNIEDFATKLEFNLADLKEQLGKLEDLQPGPTNNVDSVSQSTLEKRVSNLEAMALTRYESLVKYLTQVEQRVQELEDLVPK